MVNVDLYSAIITKVSNALDTLVSGEKPGFQTLSEGQGLKLICRKMRMLIIIIIIKGIYIAQVRKGHKCAMSAEMAVWLRNCLYLYSYLSHN